MISEESRRKLGMDEFIEVLDEQEAHGHILPWLSQNVSTWQWTAFIHIRMLPAQSVSYAVLNSDIRVEMFQPYTTKAGISTRT